MAVDNIVQSIVVQTNPTDPTQSVLAGRRQGGAVSNIPFIQGDTIDFRIFLVELDQTTGLLRDRKLETGESMNMYIRNAADDATLTNLDATLTTGSAVVAEAGSAAEFNIYAGTNLENLSGEYVAMSFLNAQLTAFHPVEEKIVFWFRTGGNSLPPNLEGYRSIAVDVAPNENPLEQLATKINTLASGSAPLVDTATYTETSTDPYVNVIVNNAGALSTQPFVSNTTKLGVEIKLIGADYIYGYENGLQLTSAAIATALGTSDSVTAKLVIQLLKTSHERTIAIQDCTIYRDFSG
tara:strand:+ start:113 stop:997 length:885 start_codon:yes stop_codon:yes gene_type:complete